MLRMLAYALGSLATVTWHRLRGHRARPSWSFGFEVLVAVMRRYARWLGTLDTKRLRQATARLTKPLPRGVAMTASSVNEIPTQRFDPTDVSSDGVILFVHGGGYVFGSAEQDKNVIAELALQAQRSTVAPDYRLAPEYPCPAAVEDIVRVYEGLLAEGIAAARIAVVGISAGAGLVLAALQSLRDARVSLPDCAVLLSPLVDLTSRRPSWTENRGWTGATPPSSTIGIESTPQRWRSMNARVFPLEGELAALPRLLVVTGDAELLRDDAMELVARARAAGVAAELHLAPDMVHGFVSFGSVAPRAGEVLEAVARFIA